MISTTQNFDINMAYVVITEPQQITTRLGVEYVLLTLKKTGHYRLSGLQWLSYNKILITESKQQKRFNKMKGYIYFL